MRGVTEPLMGINHLMSALQRGGELCLHRSEKTNGKRQATHYFRWIVHVWFRIRGENPWITN
jgi:hypothetical protein